MPVIALLSAAAGIGGPVPLYGGTYIWFNSLTHPGVLRGGTHSD